MMEQQIDTGVVKFGGDRPEEVYSARLNELHLAQATEGKRERLLGHAKVVLGVSTILCAAVFIHRVVALEFLLIPVALFIGLAVLHERVLTSIGLRGRAIQFYQERGLERIQDRWAGTGETGERFLDPSHPYARDLDLFGKASLF